MTDAIDIFSKKSVKEIEDQKTKEKEALDKAFNSKVKALLESYFPLLEENDLNSIFIGGVSKEGIVSPIILYKSSEDIHKLQFVVEECRVNIYEHCAEMYGLREIEYIEE